MSGDFGGYFRRRLHALRKCDSTWRPSSLARLSTIVMTHLRPPSVDSRKSGRMSEAIETQGIGSPGSKGGETLVGLFRSSWIVMATSQQEYRLVTESITDVGGPVNVRASRESRRYPEVPVRPCVVLTQAPRTSRSAPWLRAVIAVLSDRRHENRRRTCFPRTAVRSPAARVRSSAHGV